MCIVYIIMSFDQLTTNYINTPDNSYVSYWDVCDLIDWREPRPNSEGQTRWSISALYNTTKNLIGKDYSIEYPSSYDISAHFLTRNELVVSNIENANQWNKNTGQFTANVSGIYNISWRFRAQSNTSNIIKLEVINDSNSVISEHIINDSYIDTTDVLSGSKNIHLEKDYKIQFRVAEGSIRLTMNSQYISYSGFTVLRYRY